MLVGCVYSALVIATTTDVRLLTNSATSPLPIIGTEVPIVGFYVVAPLLLFSLYLWLHLYLQGLWESMSALPGVFPDGRPLDKRVYPWLITGLIRTRFKTLQKNKPRLHWLQAILALLLAWWVVPVTLVFFWGRFLPRHDWRWTFLHIVLLAFSIFSAILLRQTC